MVGVICDIHKCLHGIRRGIETEFWFTTNTASKKRSKIIHYSHMRIVRDGVILVVVDGRVCQGPTWRSLQEVTGAVIGVRAIGISMLPDLAY